MERYNLGHTVTGKATIRDANKVLIDPSEVVFRFIKPSAEEVINKVSEDTVFSDETGYYRSHCDTDELGVWTMHVEATVSEDGVTLVNIKSREFEVV